MTWDRSRPCETGFTLLELLAATAIFAMLGVMLFGILQGSLELWQRGETGRELSERADLVLDRLAFELRHVVVDNPRGAEGAPVQFRCEWVGADTDGDSLIDRRAQRLRFVRVAYEMRQSTLMADAGSDPLATEVFNSSDDEQRGGAPSFLPPGGLAEVCFFPAGRTGPRDDGTLRLFRAFRSPIGVEGSLFDDLNVLDPLAAVAGDAASFQELAVGILHLGYRFRFTSSEPFGKRGVGGALEDGGGRGIWRVWDSTRAVLPPGGGVNAFSLSQTEETSDEDPLSRTVDDVFPYQVEITLILARTGADATATELRLPTALETDRPLLEVRSTTALRHAEGTERLVKVGGEWMAIKGVNSAVIQVVKRGLLGSPRAPHAVGAPVRFGRLFRRVVTLPCYREDFNQ